MLLAKAVSPPLVLLSISLLGCARGCNGTMPAMCARYDSVLNASRLQQFFRMKGLRDFAHRSEIFPGLSAPFIRRPREYGSGDEAVPDREARVADSGSCRTGRTTRSCAGQLTTLLDPC
jgi:hypothetical protein